MMRKLIFPSSVIAVSVAAILVATCGARLPQEVSINRPNADALPIDMTKVNFTELASGNTINVAEYMDTHNLNYLLLTFGSQSCSACMEKARYLQTNLVADSYKLLGDKGKAFELHGVNTDVESSRPMVLKTMLSQHLSHINWADRTDAGSMMMTFFQPEGKLYGVPLTVMVDRFSIKWRVASDEHVTPEEILARVAKTLETDYVVKPTPTPTIKPQVPWSALAEEQPGRLKALPASRCGAPAAVNVQDVLGEADLKFLVVDKENCADGSICDQDRAAVLDFIGTCSGKVCQLATLGQTVKEGDAACAKGVMAGGNEIFTTFKEHFNWDYPLSFDDNGFTLGAVKGPLVLAFDASGKLVFSKEGAVTKADLAARWSSDQFTNRAVGPAFEFYRATGRDNFSTWRQRSKYSVVQLWKDPCGGCIKELYEWQQPGGLIEWCNQRSEFCQVISVEGSYPADNNPNSVPNYFDTVFAPLMKSKNLNPADLAVDLLPNVPDDQMPRKWLEGWAAGNFNGADARALIYDREAKVRGTWIRSESDTTDPLFDALKQLWNAEHP